MVSQRNTNMAIASTIVPFPDMIACSLSEFWLFLCSEQDCELQASQKPAQNLTNHQPRRNPNRSDRCQR
jgi:hypothetical protein